MPQNQVVKSLGGWADFPTPDPGGFCCIEEPAKLVEHLGTRKVTLAGPTGITERLASQLDRLLPTGIATAAEPPKSPRKDEAVVVVDDAGIPGHLAGFLGGTGKGRGILSDGDALRLGNDRTSKVADLPVRFAELAHAEGAGSER